jgi:fibronectin-binding autotransporter adhesin
VSLPGATSTLDLNGTSQHIGSLDGSGTIKLGAGTLGVTQNVDGTFSGTIMDGGNLTKDGPATLTLTGPSSYTGITTVDAGILSVASSGALGTSNVTVTSGATLNIADGVALTSPSSINLAGTGVTRSGASVGALMGTGHRVVQRQPGAQRRYWHRRGVGRHADPRRQPKWCRQPDQTG